MVSLEVLAVHPRLHDAAEKFGPERRLRVSDGFQSSGVPYGRKIEPPSCPSGALRHCALKLQRELPALHHVPLSVMAPRR